MDLSYKVLVAVNLDLDTAFKVSIAHLKSRVLR